MPYKHKIPPYNRKLTKDNRF